MNISAAIMVAFLVGQIFHNIFSCVPVALAWDKTIQHGKCVDERIAAFYISSFGLVSDLIVFFVPCQSIWRLHKSTLQRIGLIVLFAIGAM